MGSSVLVNVEVGGREYDGDHDFSRSFPVAERNIPALEKKLTEWSEKLAPEENNEQR